MKWTTRSSQISITNLDVLLSRVMHEVPLGARFDSVLIYLEFLFKIFVQQHTSHLPSTGNRHALQPGSHLLDCSVCSCSLKGKYMDQQLPSQSPQPPSTALSSPGNHTYPAHAYLTHSPWWAHFLWTFCFKKKKKKRDYLQEAVWNRSLQPIQPKLFTYCPSLILYIHGTFCWKQILGAKIIFLLSSSHQV